MIYVHVEVVRNINNVVENSKSPVITGLWGFCPRKKYLKNSDLSTLFKICRQVTRNFMKFF